MSSNNRVEIDVSDAGAPMREGVFRMVRNTDNPEHVQLQMEFPKDMSTVAVMNVDDLFMALRTLLPEFSIQLQPTLLPTMLSLDNKEAVQDEILTESDR
jgi:hypothetical protein